MKNISRRNLLATGTAALVTLAGSGFAAAAGNMPQTTRDMPLRRKSAEITKEECFEVIKRVDHAVLGTADASGEPYAVPVTPFLVNDRLFFHGMGGNSGRKAANIRQNPRVSMCFIAYAKTDAVKLDVDYVSVIVAGDVVEVKDKADKVALMRKLMERHTPTHDINKAIADREKKIELITGVYEIKIRSITGKAKGAAYEAYFGRKRLNAK